MIGYRLLPEHVRMLPPDSRLELVHWLSRVCGLEVEGVLAIDMMWDVDGIVMEAHVRDTKFSDAISSNVIDVKTFKLQPQHNVPRFLVKQFERAVEVPAGGFGDVDIQTMTNARFIVPN